MSQDDTMSGVRRYRYDIVILCRYRVYPISGIPISVYCDIMPISGYPTRISGVHRYPSRARTTSIPAGGYTSSIPDIGIPDIGCTPISGIIEISADIGVNITIYRYRRTYADTQPGVTICVQVTVRQESIWNPHHLTKIRYIEVYTWIYRDVRF